MAAGGGRYDAELTAAVAAAKAKDPTVVGGILIIKGRPGTEGFSCQLPLSDLLAIPSVLRQVADVIEADLERGHL